jgi:hypothetical protein
LRTAPKVLLANQSRDPDNPMAALSAAELNDRRLPAGVGGAAEGKRRIGRIALPGRQPPPEATQNIASQPAIGRLLRHRGGLSIMGVRAGRYLGVSFGRFGRCP